MCISGLFRIIAAFRLSLSNDELSALTRARFDSFGEMISKGVYIDFHPAGVQTFIYYWIKLFGDHPFVFRFPFLIAGIISTWLIFKIGKSWFSSFTGLFAAGIFSVFQFTILYSFFARLYSPGLLFSLLSVYAFTRLFIPKEGADKKENTLFWWILFTLSMIACVHTHYFSLVFAAGVGITGLFFVQKELLRYYFFSGMIIVLSFIPELFIFIEQIGTGDIGGWLAPPSDWYLLKFVVHIFNDSVLIGGSILVLTLVGSFLMIRNREWTKFHTLCLVWFLFSFLTAYFYSIFRHPVIQYSTLFFVCPFLFLLFSHAIERIVVSSRGAVILVPFLLLGGSFHTLFAKGLFTSYSFGVFKEVAEDIKRWTEKPEFKDMKLIVNVINPEYLNYYFRLQKFEPDVFLWKVEERRQLVDLANRIDSIESDHFCFAWTNSEHPYEIIRMVRSKYPVILERNVYFNSATYLFSKKGVSVCEEPLLSINFDSDSRKWIPSSLDLPGSEEILILDSLTEYGPGFQEQIKNIPEAKFKIITSSFYYRSTNKNTNASLVISFDSLNVPVLYNSLSLDECNLIPGEWQKVYFTRVIPDDLDLNYYINTYLYNKEKSYIELKNYQVTIENWDDPYKSGK